MRKLVLSVLIVLIICNFSLSAQNIVKQDVDIPTFSVGSTGSGWYYISTPGFEIIFPSELESDAQYVANLLEATVDAVYSNANGEKLRRRKWKIVLSNSSFLPNGYVAVAPRKSQWYDLPAYDTLGSLEWYAVLASHETRHMAQFDDLSTGFVSFLKVFLGDYGEAVGINGALPRWYFEGDAVVTETLLSNSGRGRSGAFKTGYVPLLLGEYADYINGDPIPAEDRPSLAQMVHLSYKRNIPSRYVLGYHLVNYVRKVYGDEAWNRIARKATWTPIPNASLSLAVRKETGKSVSVLYREMEQELAKLWDAQYRQFIPGAAPLSLPEWEQLLSPDDQYTRYGAAYSGSTDNSVYIERYNYEKGTRICRVNTESGEIEDVFWNFSSSHGVSFSQEKAVWIERKYDSIQAETVYGEIRVLDLNTKQVETLGKQGRFYRASINSFGDTIAALSFSLARIPSLHVFSLINGSWEFTKEVSLPESYEAAEISTLAENTFLVTVRGPDGMGLLRYSQNSIGENWETLISGVNWQLGSAVSNGADIFIEGDIKGVSGIWKIEEKALSLITAGGYGARSPSIHNGQLYFSNYCSVNGESLSRIALSEIQPVPYDTVPDFSESYLFRKEGSTAPLRPPFAYEALSNLPNKKWAVKKYPLIKRIPNYHSRIPIVDITNSSVSLSLISNDVLGTTEMLTSGYYSFDTQDWTASHQIEFISVFPKVALGAYAGSYSSSSENYDILPSGYIQLSFPLNFTKGKWQSPLSFTMEADATYFDDGSSLDFVTPFYYSGGYSALLNHGYRGYQPYLGFSIFTTYGHMPFYDLSEYEASGRMAVYFPGVFPHAGISVNFQTEYQTPAFLESRGYVPGYDSINTTYSSMVSAAWDIPFAYPDFNFLHLTFTKRLRLGLYADAGWASFDPSFSLYSETPDISCRAGLIDDFTILSLEFLEISLSGGAGYSFKDFDDFDQKNIFPWFRLTSKAVN